MKKTILLTCVGMATAAALINAPLAAASQADADFLAALDADGIEYGNDNGAVEKVAKEVCNDLENGGTLASVTHQVSDATSLSDKGTAHFVRDAINAYCPGSG